MYPHDIHCPTNVQQPQPTGWCDRCYRKFFLSDLAWQWDVSGNKLANRRIRVCCECYDEPATTLYPIRIIGPEGTVRDPRPPNYAANFAGGVSAPANIGQFLYSWQDIPPDEEE